MSASASAQVATKKSSEDNLYLSVNQRTYINTNASVNIDDVLDNRPGGAIRGQGPMSDAIGTLVQPNMTAPAYQFNEYIGSWGENRTGYNRYSAGTDANALNKTARGTELLTAKADMRMGVAAKLLLISFDSTLRSNLSVGLPLDLATINLARGRDAGIHCPGT